MVLLLLDVWGHLEDNIFDDLKHKFLKGCEALVEVFSDCEAI